MIEWKKVPSVPGYWVSNEGQVKRDGASQLRKPYVDKRGYYFVGMKIDGKQCCRSVHSLVAEAFHGPRPDGADTRHLDGDPGNNRPENLLYGTALENAADREAHGRTRRGERNGNAKLSDDDAYSLKVFYSMGLINQYQAADMFGISQAQVNNIILGKQRRRAA
jgi:hypothetical protein